MPNKSKQGKRYELEIRKFLESTGWQVEPATNKTLWIKGRTISIAHDFFGIFDGIAIKNQSVLFYQVSVLEEKSHKISKIMDNPVDWTKFNVHIYLRVRNTRPIHFRILKSENNWTWDGDVAIINQNTPKIHKKPCSLPLPASVDEKGTPALSTYKIEDSAP